MQTENPPASHLRRRRQLLAGRGTPSMQDTALSVRCRLETYLRHSWTGSDSAQMFTPQEGAAVQGALPPESGAWEILWKAGGGNGPLRRLTFEASTATRTFIHRWGGPLTQTGPGLTVVQCSAGPFIVELPITLMPYPAEVFLHVLGPHGAQPLSNRRVPWSSFQGL